MFKKKTWKRGDKITVKELNRIEDGIANGSSSAATIDCITVETDISDISNGNITFSNWSITPEEFTNIQTQQLLIPLKTIAAAAGTNTILYPTTFVDNKITFTAFVPDMGHMKIELGLVKDSGELQGLFSLLNS